jgi:hypothetical protein
MVGDVDRTAWLPVEWRNESQLLTREVRRRIRGNRIGEREDRKVSLGVLMIYRAESKRESMAGGE